MATLGTTDYTQDNLVTATKKLITAKVYQLEAGGSVVRGEVLKRGTTGLVAIDATSDVPYAVALQTIDATSAVANIDYTYDGSLLGSELTFGAGTIADFRDGFVANTNLFIEE